MTSTRRTFLRTAAGLAALPALATTARAQTTHTVRIRNMAFTPADLTINAGDTVTWINEDRMRHSAWQDTGNAFDTGLLSPGDSASLTFGGPGGFSYRCRPHASMRGTITVV
ncbi:cupredoxin domain-containing protein [Thalassorhabdomicrobium marinisediminis]|uniref:cupredoxin domain-containing protein n=1 Tax=Thalassorhabdomicrobium marinisediminis TaxID=2170577 RepID=UPI00249266B2|nr:cupredoxin family copper-binding protein [Thalassorhabdomicrobium marinisediminis]